SICLQFEEFHFNDHGCYQGLIQFTADTEHSQKQMFSSVHFEVCPTTMDCNAYTKSINLEV
uniref:Uncharacterized protein n=1 Tax=Romanomermis culicivorax TaxID=13658 RepID=A0A915JW02_ROMCU